jgi:NAD(P)-dependent dehydrogenase (short-subunit alcohol dehydrogenase family)/acyl dehydratase/putative sterol carrier protein
MALDLGSIGAKIGPITRDYQWKDVVLYALGVGAGFDDLEYCYENKLKVLPSFSIGAVFDFLAQVAATANVNLAGVLHGEQDIIFHSPIPPDGTLTTEGAITNLYDKGADKGALVVAEADTFHSNGRRLFTNVFTLFCRKDGGFGGPNSPQEPVEFPDRAPDFEEEALPSADQPLLYRLSGDIFALHVDPDFAQASGFSKPILHGLCTHGFACRAVIKHLFPGEPERMKRFRARFSRTIYPGIPIRTQIWKIDEGTALFRTINTESGETVIDRGIVEWASAEEAETGRQGPAIRFDGRVAIVTGAGAGLGRIYALELGKRGAKVVVNDLGGARDGAGGSQGPADEVVQEIKAMGGEAVASYDSVATEEGGEAIVAKAIEAFGRVDILINNAGILRDKTLVKMEAHEWAAVMAVHLDAAYYVTRPAFLKMRENGYGRIIVTTSGSGLFGNFGQSNYGAAKMGLIGFMNTLKLEGDRNNIKINAVAPLAATRLTEDVMPPDLFKEVRPELVAPLVLFLCSENCRVSGNTYNAGMGHFSRVAVVTGPGVTLGENGQPPSAEDVARAFKGIVSLEGAEEYESATAALAGLLKPASAAEVQSGEPAPTMTVDAIFSRIDKAFQPQKAQGIDVVFQFCIDQPGGGEWHVTVKDQKCEAKPGQHASPNTTITMSAADFLGLVQGKLNALQAYTSGKLKIKGDLMKSQLIEKLFKFGAI